MNWKEVLKRLAGDAAREGAKSFLRYLKPGDREKAARQAIALFAHEWLEEGRPGR